MTDQGVPIMNEPYVRGQNRTRPQVYRPRDYMTKTLLTVNQENDAKMKLTWNNKNNSPKRFNNVYA